MKRRLLGILLVLCMLVSTLAVLASCGEEDPTPTPPSGVTNPEDGVLTPIGPDNTSKVVTELTAETLEGILEEFKGAYEEAPELDITELIKDVNLYAKYGDMPVSVKDGYITAGDATVGFKDGYMVMVENGAITDAELIVETVEDEQVAAYCDMIANQLSAIIATGHLPEITAADLYRSAEWYFFTDAYISRLVKGAFYLIYEMESEQPITDMEKAQIDPMIDAYLEAIKIKIGFAAEGEAINGVLLSVKVDDISALAGGEEGVPSGSASVRIEAKLSKDLTALNYIKASADVDVKDMVEADVDCSIICASDKVTYDLKAKGESMGQKYDEEIVVSITLDENGLPTVLKVDSDIKASGVRLNSDYASDEEGFYEIYGMGDLTVDASVMIDLSKLAGSGKVVDAKVTLATSNVTIAAEGEKYDEESYEYVDIDSSEALSKFTDEEKAAVTNADEFNFTVTAGLTTENGAGVASATYTPKGGEPMTFELEVAVNSDKAVAPGDDIKDLIANCDPSEYIGDTENGENRISLYEYYYERATILAKEGLILIEMDDEGLSESGAIAGFSLSTRTGMSSLYVYEFAAEEDAQAFYEANQNLTDAGMKIMTDGNVVIFGTEDLFTSINE